VYIFCTMFRHWESFYRGLLISGATILLLNTQSHALILDWDTVSWPSGSMQQSYDIDSNNPGNDITVSISSSALYLSPQLSKTYTGGLQPPENSLELQALFLSGQSVAVTIDFHYEQGVRDISFNLFDVDKGVWLLFFPYTDRIQEIKGRDLLGQAVAATSVIGSENNIVEGKGLNTVVTGTGTAPNDSGSGNVQINFGSIPVNQVSFKFVPAAGLSSYGIAVHDINFTPVPEPNSAIITAILCGLFGYWRMFRHQK